MADTPQQAALRARYPTVWDLARAFCVDNLPAGTDWSDLPVYCPPSVAPRDTFQVWSYSSARQICGADGRDLELRPDVRIKVRGCVDAAGWTAWTHDGSVTVTDPTGYNRMLYFEGPTCTFRFDARDYPTATIKAFRELQSKLATIILAHEASPQVPCRGCGQRPGIHAVGTPITAEPEPCGDCQRASFRAWNKRRYEVVE
jgi:hypothetical protein